MHPLVRACSLALLTTVFVVGCSPGKTNEDVNNASGPVEAPGPPAWEANYNEMVEALSLTPGEQDAVRGAFERGYAEMTARLEGDEGQELEAEEAKLKEAVKNKDLAAVRTITRRAGPKRQALVAGVKQIQEDILLTLSPEKQLAWKGHQIAQDMVELMEDLGLTAEQEAAIRANAVAAVQAAQQAGAVNPMAKGFLDLEAWVEQQVLGPQQYEGYQPVKEANSMRSLQW